MDYITGFHCYIFTCNMYMIQIWALWFFQRLFETSNLKAKFASIVSYWLHIFISQKQSMESKSEKISKFYSAMPLTETYNHGIKFRLIITDFDVLVDKKTKWFVKKIIWKTTVIQDVCTLYSSIGLNNTAHV